MESLDCVQPGSSFLTVGLTVSAVHIRPPAHLGGKKKTGFSNNKSLHVSSLTHTHARMWQQQHLPPFPFNCQRNICSCQSPAHRVICAFSLCLVGLAFQGVAVGFAGRLGLLASGRLGGAMKSNSPRCIMLEVTGRICGTWLSEEEDETEISVAARAGLSLCFPSV